MNLNYLNDYVAENGLEGTFEAMGGILENADSTTNLILANYYNALGRLVEVGLNHLDEAGLDESFNIEALRAMATTFETLAEGMMQYEINQMFEDADDE